VLLVKRSRPYRHPNLLVAVDPGHAHSKPAQLDNVLLCVGSALAEALRGKAHVVHAYPPVVLGSAAANVKDSSMTQWEDLASSDARIRFQHLLEASNIPQTRRYLVGDLPAKAIEEAARRTRTDIVVMGALSRSGLKRLLFGNTAERLFDQLPCDLLVVKPAQFASQVSARCNGPRLKSRFGFSV
jgi:universal stress protein E